MFAVMFAGLFAVMFAGVTGVVSAQTHIIRLDRNRFMPAVIRAHPGDTVKFVNGEGGPHNVEFEADSIPPETRTAIDDAIGPQRIRPLVGPMLILVNQTFTFIVPDLPAGRYPWLCGPHYGNMRGALIVERWLRLRRRTIQ